MRIGIALVIVGAVVGGIVLHRHHEEPTAPPPAATASTAALASPRPASEHDWAKSALDRAADVKRQVAQKRKENDRE
jgi:hypothetical protein